MWILTRRGNQEVDQTLKKRLDTDTKKKKTTADRQRGKGSFTKHM